MMYTRRLELLYMITIVVFFPFAIANEGRIIRGCNVQWETILTYFLLKNAHKGLDNIRFFVVHTRG